MDFAAIFYKIGSLIASILIAAHIIAAPYVSLGQPTIPPSQVRIAENAIEKPLILPQEKAAPEETSPPLAQVSQDISSEQLQQVANDNAPTPVEWYLDERYIWLVKGNPPPCPDPIVLKSPADMRYVNAFLYPGQPRGPEFKNHGAFKYPRNGSPLTAVIPFDAYVVRGSHVVLNGEDQYAFEFTASCGIKYFLGHLRVLTPKFQDIINTLPANDERSPFATLREPVAVSTGEVVAIEVGYRADKEQVFFDFGVYDRRKKNGNILRPEWIKFKDSFDEYGVCWLDWLPPEDTARLRGLGSTGDFEYLNKSDFCHYPENK